MVVWFEVENYLGGCLSGGIVCWGATRICSDFLDYSDFSNTDYSD